MSSTWGRQWRCQAVSRTSGDGVVVSPHRVRATPTLVSLGSSELFACCGCRYSLPMAFDVAIFGTLALSPGDMKAWKRVVVDSVAVSSHCARLSGEPQPRAVRRRSVAQGSPGRGRLRPLSHRARWRHVLRAGSVCRASVPQALEAARRIVHEWGSGRHPGRRLLSRYGRPCGLRRAAFRGPSGPRDARGR